MGGAALSARGEPGDAVLAGHTGAKHALLANPGTDADTCVGRRRQPRLWRHHRTATGHGCLGRLDHAIVAIPGPNDTIVANPDGFTGPGHTVLADPIAVPGSRLGHLRQP